MGWEHRKIPLKTILLKHPLKDCGKTARFSIPYAYNMTLCHRIEPYKSKYLKALSVWLAYENAISGLISFIIKVNFVDLFLNNGSYDCFVVHQLIGSINSLYRLKLPKFKNTISTCHVYVHHKWHNATHPQKHNDL